MSAAADTLTSLRSTLATSSGSPLSCTTMAARTVRSETFNISAADACDTGLPTGTSGKFAEGWTSDL